MLQQTKGIVIKTTKYGETSLICNIFTEKFGLQSYMVKGIRKTNGNNRTSVQSMFPTAVVDMIVEHKPKRSLQYIKEANPYFIRQDTIHEDIVKNCVLTYMVELLNILLYEQACQQQLFDFTIEVINFLHETTSDSHIAHLPLFFTIQAGKIMGYQINGKYDALKSPALNLETGSFISSEQMGSTMIDQQLCPKICAYNQINSCRKASTVPSTQQERKNILEIYLAFLKIHLPYYRELKSIKILSNILN